MDQTKNTLYKSICTTFFCIEYLLEIFQLILCYKFNELNLNHNQNTIYKLLKIHLHISIIIRWSLFYEIEYDVYFQYIHLFFTSVSSIITCYLFMQIKLPLWISRFQENKIYSFLQK